MGKPRLIILIRHAQSEGNKNREIHQMIPDHRVKLTDEGRRQAEEAGRRLRKLLKPDDTLQIFTSPYRRTRETTEGILKTLTARDDPDDPSAAPSPFSRSKIKVYEEPRIREQDFGNFQPCSSEMERMWSERADYGHFFYRIPNGESAADAYDRIAGFNESLWRQFGDAKFPSVCVLVTHGLMTRVFLMKWYHWSVEYFEDLRNINHCEFIVMEKNPDNGKYNLNSQLRTWSELKQQRETEEEQADPQRHRTLSHFLTEPVKSPTLPSRQWGGCAEGCNHDDELYPRRAAQRKQQVQQDLQLPTGTIAKDSSGSGLDSVSAKSTSQAQSNLTAEPLPYDQNVNVGTPHERSEDEAHGYFATTRGRSLAVAVSKHPARKATPEDVERWASESGMNKGQKADVLGDEPNPEDSHEDEELAREQPSHVVRENLEQAEAEDRSLRGSVY